MMDTEFSYYSMGDYYWPMHLMPLSMLFTFGGGNANGFFDQNAGTIFTIDTGCDLFLLNVLSIYTGSNSIDSIYPNSMLLFSHFSDDFSI